MFGIKTDRVDDGPGSRNGRDNLRLVTYVRFDLGKRSATGFFPARTRVVAGGRANGNAAVQEVLDDPAPKKA
jgi:hypothetical protein